MEALGLLFVGTTFLMLIGHAADELGGDRRAGSNSARRHAHLMRVLAQRSRSGNGSARRSRVAVRATRFAVPRKTGT